MSLETLQYELALALDEFVPVRVRDEAIEAVIDALVADPTTAVVALIEAAREGAGSTDDEDGADDEAEAEAEAEEDEPEVAEDEPDPEPDPEPAPPPVPAPPPAPSVPRAETDRARRAAARVMSEVQKGTPNIEREFAAELAMVRDVAHRRALEGRPMRGMVADMLAYFERAKTATTTATASPLAGSPPPGFVDDIELGEPGA